jgi:hypothetical protein
MNNHFSKILLRWTLAFVLFYSAILDLKTGYFGNFPKLIDFYFIVLAVWLFWGKKIIWCSYLTFITFALLAVYKMINSGFSFGFYDLAMALVSLALIGLIKSKI